MLTEEDPPQRDTLGRLVLDINNIYNRAQDDLTLSGGDKIVIPKTPQTVKVIGEVFAPNSHFFDDSKDLYDYISLSGGFNDFADEKNVYVIRPNGSVFNFDSSSGFFRNANNKDIRPGDTVVVPLEIETFDGLRATTEITQIIYQMALSAAAVNSF